MPGDNKFQIQFEQIKPFSPDDFKQAASDIENKVKELSWSMELNEGQSYGEVSFVYDIMDEKGEKIGKVAIENQEGMSAGPRILFEEERGPYSSEPIRDKSRIKSFAAHVLDGWK